MQLGFSTYIELMFEQPELFNQLMKINEAFCVDWANAQLEAGATAICYFDPVSSPNIIPKEKFIETGFEIGKRTIAKINGPVAIHHASGISIPIADELSQMGAGIIGVSTNEDLGDLKSAFKNKLTVLGNLNAVEMRRWTPKTTEEKVKEAIQKAGKGGGFILADNHGEIPWQVPHEVLKAISDAVHKWGKYPIN